MKRTIEEDLFGGKMKQPINQKQKGNRNELMLTKLLTEWTGHEFVRVPRSGGLRWKNTANICGDVISTDPLFDFPYNVETKHLKSLGFNYKDTLNCSLFRLRSNSVILSIFKQADVDASRSGKKPILIIRHNDMPKNEYILFIKTPGNDLHLALLRNDLTHNIVVSSDDYYLIGYRLSDVMKIPYKKLMK